MIKHALSLTDETHLAESTKQIKEETVKLLCVICTVKTNRFYIPGETKLVERLRKEAFDKGIFAALTFLYKNLKGRSEDLKKYIKEKVLNLIELSDLFYHAGVIEQLMDLLKRDPNMFKTNQPSAEDAGISSQVSELEVMTP